MDENIEMMSDAEEGSGLLVSVEDTDSDLVVTHDGDGTDGDGDGTDGDGDGTDSDGTDGDGDGTDGDGDGDGTDSDGTD